MVPILLLIVGIIVIGVGILAYRNRSERGIESGITSFRRELSALAPRNDPADSGSPRPDAPADDAPADDAPADDGDTTTADDATTDDETANDSDEVDSDDEERDP